MELYVGRRQPSFIRRTGAATKTAPSSLNRPQAPRRRPQAPPRPRAVGSNRQCTPSSTSLVACPQGEPEFDLSSSRYFPFLKYSNQNGYLQIEVPPPPPEPAETSTRPITQAEAAQRLPSQITVFPLTGVWAEHDDINMEPMDQHPDSMAQPFWCQGAALQRTCNVCLACPGILHLSRIIQF